MLDYVIEYVIECMYALADVLVCVINYDTFGALVQLPVPVEVEFQNCYFL